MGDVMSWVILGVMISVGGVIQSKLSRIEWQLQAAQRRLDAIAAHLNLNVEGAMRLDVLRLMRAGRKIEAIKVYRVATGLGLAEAKKAVEQLELSEGTSPTEIIHA